MKVWQLSFGRRLAHGRGHGGISLSRRRTGASRVLRRLRAGGSAEPGEFTRRAFLNGKMDLTQAEAVMDVTERYFESPASRAGTAHRSPWQEEKIRSLLAEIVAHLEACIDFPEEGIDPHTGEQLADIGQVRPRNCRPQPPRVGYSVHSAPSSAGRRIPANPACSIAFRLRPRHRERHGNNRDTIEELASLRGLPFHIIDTAGLRETADAVEPEGVERSKQDGEGRRECAWLTPATRWPAPTTEIVAYKRLTFLTGESWIALSRFRVVSISCLTGEELTALSMPS